MGALSTVCPILERRRRLLAILIALTFGVTFLVAVPTPASVAPCDSLVVNQIACENTRTANPSSEWNITWFGSASIQGFASDISPIRSSTIGLRVKRAANTCTHTGSLWSSGGTRLGTVTFSGESASRWQQATFAAPVAVNANTTYVASYFATAGRSITKSYFASAATTRGPLTALRSGTDGGNGVYHYGSTASPTAHTYPPTTGSTWSSRRTSQHEIGGSR